MASNEEILGVILRGYVVRKILDRYKDNLSKNGLELDPEHISVLERTLIEEFTPKSVGLKETQKMEWSILKSLPGSSTIAGRVWEAVRLFGEQNKPTRELFRETVYVPTDEDALRLYQKAFSDTTESGKPKMYGVSYGFGIKGLKLLESYLIARGLIKEENDFLKQI